MIISVCVKDSQKVHKVNIHDELVRLRKRNEELNVMLHQSFQEHLLNVVIPELENDNKRLEAENKKLKGMIESTKNAVYTVIDTLEEEV